MNSARIAHSPNIEQHAKSIVIIIIVVVIVIIIIIIIITMRTNDRFPEQLQARKLSVVVIDWNRSTQACTTAPITILLLLLSSFIANLPLESWWLRWKSNTIMGTRMKLISPRYYCCYVFFFFFFAILLCILASSTLIIIQKLRDGNSTILCVCVCVCDVLVCVVKDRHGTRVYLSLDYE